MGSNPVNHYTLTAVDPANRNIVYGLRGGNLDEFVRSVDGGTNWDAIVATLTPTIAKPASSISVDVLEGGPYQQLFTIQTFENAAWKTPVTLTTSGASWLALTATSGMTPLSTGIRIDTAGLAPGTYQATVTVNAPQTFNKAVTFAVVLTVHPFGTVQHRYVISTVAGSGATMASSLQGPPLDLGLGATRAVAFDPNGNLWISAGNRLWRTSGQTLSAVAGNGMKGSSGDGLDPLSASISDPGAIAFDQQALPYFTEYDPGRVRRIANSTLNTRVTFSTFNFTTGSHALLIDEFGQLIMVAPEGVLIYDGVRVKVAAPYAFRDPYGLARDATGNLYVSDRVLNQIFKVTPQNTVSVFAGRGEASFGGDGGLATQAYLSQPAGLALGPDGTLYIADTGNQRIRAIGADGIIHTVAGSGLRGFSGDGAIADFAAFQEPLGLAVGPDGRIYVADSGSNRIRVLELKDVMPPPPPPPVIDSIGRGGAEGIPLAPGGLFSIYGSALADMTDLAAAIPWPLSLGSASITVNGIPTPLYYTSDTQINGQIPYEVVAGNATLVVTVGGQSAQITFEVVPASPGLLIYNGNRAVAVNPDGSVNGPSAPARPGDVLVLYLSGLGVTTPPVATGAAAPGDPLAQVAYTHGITVGGLPAEVFYLGQTPGYPSLAQANFKVPDLPPGDYQIVVTINGVSSNAVLLTIVN